MNAMTSVGLKGYRLDLDFSSRASRILQTAIQLAPTGTLVLPVIGDVAPDATVDEQTNYNNSYNSLKPIVAQFPSIPVWEVGNELDNWIGMSGDGSTINQYDHIKYIAARGFIRGMIAAVHAASPNAKVSINDAGWCHYGMMNQLYADGVRWDITSVHWYGNMGNIINAHCGPGGSSNILQIHAAYGNPIWITECNFDASGGSIKGMADYLPTLMGQLSNLAPVYNIQATFIYELYAFKNDGNGYLGIFDKIGASTVASRAVKNWISQNSNPSWKIDSMSAGSR